MINIISDNSENNNINTIQKNKMESNNNNPTLTNSEFEFHSIQNQKGKPRKVIKFGMFNKNGTFIKTFTSTQEIKNDKFLLPDVYHSMLGNKNKIVLKKQFVFRDLTLSNTQTIVGEKYSLDQFPLRISQRNVIRKETIHIPKPPKAQKTGFKKIPLLSKIKMMLGIEIWRQVEIDNTSYNYAVSSYGRIKNISRNKFLAITNHRDGYQKINLSHNNVITTQFIHRLVATAFIPNPQNAKEVNHKDMFKTNNHHKNLEWMSKQENINHFNKRNRKKINIV